MLLCFSHTSYSCKLALMGAHEEESVLLQTLTRRVVLNQVSTAAIVFRQM